VKDAEAVLGLVEQLKNHPAWTRLLALLRQWAVEDAVAALDSSVSEHTRGAIQGQLRLIEALDADRLRARVEREREAKRMSRFGPLTVPGVDELMVRTNEEQQVEHIRY
jgi:hypothetical protein